MTDQSSPRQSGQGTSAPRPSPETDIALPLALAGVSFAIALTLTVIMIVVPDAHNGAVLTLVVLCVFLSVVGLSAKLLDTGGAATDVQRKWMIGGLVTVLVGALLIGGAWYVTEPDCPRRSEATPAGVTVDRSNPGLFGETGPDNVASDVRVTVSVQDEDALDPDSFAGLGPPLGEWLLVHIVHENIGSRQVVVYGSRYKLIACEDVYPPTRPGTLTINPKLGGEMLVMFDIPEGLLDDPDRPVYLEHVNRWPNVLLSVPALGTTDDDRLHPGPPARSPPMIPSHIPH